MKSLDQQVLGGLDRDMGGPEAVARIMTMYLGKLPKESLRLHELAGSGDMAGLSEQSHRMKSSTAMLGAIRLAEILAELEAAAKAGDAESVTACLSEYDLETSRVEREMKQFVA